MDPVKVTISLNLGFSPSAVARKLTNFCCCSFF